MATPTLRDIIGNDAVAEGVEEVCAAIEAEGWTPRKRIGDRGVVYWPENGRRRQVVIDITYPMNEHKRAHLTEHTGVMLMQEQTEEES